MTLKTELRDLFGARLRALRAERGWTGADAAARVGCSEGYYYKLERGAQDCSLEMVARLAQTYHLDEVDLFTFPGASPLRHGIYDLLRRAPEAVLMRTKLFVMEQLGETATSTAAEEQRPRGRKRAAR